MISMTLAMARTTTDLGDGRDDVRGAEKIWTTAGFHERR